MKKYSKLKTALVVAIMSFSMINTVIAADTPIELKGDVIEYNAQTDMAIATGGVTIIRDGGVLTGQVKQHIILKHRKLYYRWCNCK